MHAHGKGLLSAIALTRESDDDRLDPRTVDLATAHELVAGKPFSDGYRMDPTHPIDRPMVGV